MKYYAVIDTNVIVSAMIKRDSVPGSILELALSGVIVPLLNDEIIEEYRAVLSRDKFHLPKIIIDTVIRELENAGIFVDKQSFQENIPDPDDRVFYEVVMTERKTEDAYLVTGNIKHFPVKPFIVTPREMLDIIILSSEEN